MAGVATALTYLQIVLGGVVRTTESGTGCGTSWPLCHGHLLPALQLSTLIEFGHRVMATLVTLAVLLTCLVAWWAVRRGGSRLLAKMATIALALVVFEAILGGVAVLLNLPPTLIIVHYADALFIAGLLLTVFLLCFPAPSSSVVVDTAVVRQLLAGLAAVVLLVISGGLVVGTGATFACGSWPLCRGGLGLSGSTLDVVQEIHRGIAGLVVLFVLHLSASTWRRAGRIPGVGPVALLTAVCFLFEAAMGAAIALSHQDALFRALHEAFAAASWLTLLSMTVLVARHRWDLLGGRGGLGSTSSPSPLGSG